MLPHVAMYAGWDWHGFVTDKPFANRAFDVDGTGYAFGMQFQHPLVSTVGGWIRAGGVYNHIELENSVGSIIADSGHELGWELGGGLRVPVGSRFALTPGVRYRTRCFSAASREERRAASTQLLERAPCPSGGEDADDRMRVGLTATDAHGHLSAVVVVMGVSVVW